jgi:hypothetical protein
MSRRARPLAFLLPAAALALGALAPSGTAPPPVRKGFGEQVAVRETELVFGPDNDLQRTEPPSAFRVMEGGSTRPVTRAERLSADTWTAVVYVDRVLAPPATGFLAALALSRASEALAGRAKVELVVADPEPRTRLAPTREPRVLANALTDLADELRQARDRGAAVRPPDPAAVRRQLDRLVAFVAGRPRPAPRALFLVADGRDFPPTVLDALGRDRVDPATLPAEGGAAAYATAAQVLAAYGWVTFPLPFRDLPPPAGSTILGFSLAEVGRRLHGMHPRRPGDPQLAEYGAEPRLAVLRAVARMTGGGVVGSPGALAPAIADLPWRWHLWFSAPPAFEGRIHPVTVELVRTGAAVRGPQWLRSGVPEGLADARLGALLAASGPAVDLGDLTVELRVEKTRGGTTVRARLAAPGQLAAGPAGPLRVSLAVDAGGTLRRDILASPTGSVELIPPPGARRLAAVIEDLGGDRWGGAAADL